MAHRRWTYDDLSDLWKLHKKGMPIAQIAVELKRSRFTVRDKLTARAVAERSRTAKRKPFGRITAADRYREAIARQLQSLKGELA